METRNFILKKAVKEYANSKGMLVSSEFYEELNKQFQDVLDRIIERHKGINKKTLIKELL